MKYFLALCSLIPVALWQPTYAQDLYHSPYSVFGLGILNERTSSLNRSLAGSGIGIQDDHHLNHVNPASYASIPFPLSHIFEIGSYVESNRYQTNHLYESKVNGGFTNMAYWFRFKPWYASTFGLSPFSSVSYNITTKRQIAISEEGTYLFEGSGNISRLFWGHGFKAAKNLSVGLTASYLFGRIKRDETVVSDGGSNILTLENKTFSNKFHVDFGLQYKIDLLGKALTFGAVYNRGFTLDAKNDFMLTDPSYDTLADYRGEKEVYEFPEQIGAGLSFKSKKSLFTSDFRFSAWSAASYPPQEVAFRDSWKISAGYAFYGDEHGETYLQMIGMRMGFHYQDHYLVVKDTPLSAWGTTFGISLPVSDGRSLVNITYAYDRMGTLQNNLILHTAQKIQVDIVIRDVWGRKRKFD